jgi:hypothetical protein
MILCAFISYGLLIGVLFLREGYAYMKLVKPLSYCKDCPSIYRAIPNPQSALEELSTKLRKKKKLLSEEIIRESTIVLNLEVPKSDKRRVRRPNVSYTLIRRTLLHYKLRFKDMLVPLKFIVPEESSDWPKEMWGMRLGKVVQTLRAGRRLDKSDDLISIGFCYDISQSKYELVKIALMCYKNIYSDFYVPRHFQIPPTEEWPKELWNFNLGNLVTNIRSLKCYVDRKEDLLSIGFYYNVSEARYMVVKKALLRYKSKKKDMLVPNKFIIPRNNDWPVDMWGIKLGEITSKIRSGMYSDKEKELLNIGFQYYVRKRYDYETVKECIMIYRELNDDVEIPNKYRINQNDTFYPEKAWGMALGNLFGRIKRGEKWPEHRSDILNA